MAKRQSFDLRRIQLYLSLLKISVGLITIFNCNNEWGDRNRRTNKTPTIRIRVRSGWGCQNSFDKWQGKNITFFEKCFAFKFSCWTRKCYSESWISMLIPTFDFFRTSHEGYLLLLVWGGVNTDESQGCCAILTEFFIDVLWLHQQQEQDKSCAFHRCNV